MGTESQNPIATSGDVLPPIIYLLDNDAAARDGVERLLKSTGYRVRTFCSAENFLAHWRRPSASCVLLDVQLHDKSGIDLQEALRERHDFIPLVFLASNADIPTCVRAIKRGAIDFILKPFDEQILLDAVGRGVDRARKLQAAVVRSEEVAMLFSSLSPREMQILSLVVEGRTSKEIAVLLALKEITIKVRRASAMRKLRCKTVVELVMMWNGTRLPIWTMSDRPTERWRFGCEP